MAKPGKPVAAPTSPPRINVDDPDQVILLTLAALFTGIAIARGMAPLPELAQDSVAIARALIDAVLTAPAPPQ